MTEPASLQENIKAYEVVEAKMKEQHMRKHVVFYNRNFEGAFETFHDAASSAVRRFGHGPYLIREVGAPLPPLPASLWLQSANA